MRNTPQRDTPSERALRICLRRFGLRYLVDRPVVEGIRRRADVVFKAARVAVFVDGCFWHGCPIHGTWPKANAVWWRHKIEANRSRDADTNRLLAKSGWTVIRIWEHDDPDTAARHIVKRVRRRLTRLR